MRATSQQFASGVSSQHYMETTQSKGNEVQVSGGDQTLGQRLFGKSDKIDMSMIEGVETEGYMDFVGVRVPILN